ncbi:putative RNA-directed DNA polymerase from transposon X-element [Caerostris darwini]|uniref:RNA-directed DNA polymerase from transposon X-element n=1 Tax=Caerostris darwini TaxID=1538125 RepID=A0AAV4T166_9ARAC|nr:putative RNA-directed DNA polymerase from transposon X-element [Caerostris darwini]
MFRIALFVFLLTLVQGQIVLYAIFNTAGLQGNITFHQRPDDTNVTISVHLSSLSPEPRSFAWGIYSFPVFFDSNAPCSSAELGSTFHDLAKRHGSIMIPSPEGIPQVFTDSEIQLRGADTIWGRSLLLRSTAYNTDLRACANLATDGDAKTVEATFSSPVAGTVIFRQSELGETTIFANIFHITEDYTPSTNHEWRILATDILDTSREISRKRRCEYLQVLFDPNNVDDTNCSKESHQNCKIGEMTRKHGEATVGATNSRYSKRFYVDTNLPLSFAEGGLRSLYLVLYESGNAFRIMACAPLVSVKPKEVKAFISADSVKGHILLSQSYRTQPTVVTVQLYNLRGRGSEFKIHEFPVQPRLKGGENYCQSKYVGNVYNPYGMTEDKIPSPGEGSGDQYPVGDLSGKFGLLDASPLMNLHLGIHVDFNLPLFGTNSIIGRSIVITNTEGEPWICANIGYPGPTRMAVANFVFPIAGQVIFRQDAKNPYGDTTIFGEFYYIDGSVNDTMEHRWDVHDFEPGRDFYNWTKRCESTGDQFNPFGLPLSGPDKIVGKGLVIHDDTAPPHRGDRLACAGIRIRHPLKASVRAWISGPAIESNVSGLIQFSQESAYDVTEGKVELGGLAGLAGGYHIHKMWVPIDKEFPCTDDSVSGHFNPYLLNVSLGPAPGIGSNDQYEVGDLSGKHGTLDGQESFRLGEFRDANLPLHGPHSVMGRSVVIHKKVRNFRWTCATIQPDYKKDGIREVIGLASFHRQGIAVEGYIRVRQLEYADGGRGDTWIEVDLRYPGVHNRNITKGHEWAIYVNQVAHDAVEKVETSRCISAGFRWNPYIVKSDDDLYKSECNIENPYRCEMGDLSGRHGTMEIGMGRRVFTDVNLPLVGNYSVMGRSIVIFAKDGSSNKLACANILPDIHIVRHVTVKKNPGFTVVRFMTHMRDLLDAKDWLVVQDTQSQREILDGQCIQLTVHFYGPEAHRHQIEFSNLINLGSVKRNTRVGLKLIETFYKPCRNLNDVDSSVSFHASQPLILMGIIICTLLRLRSHL